MNDEDRELLKVAVKLSEDNNRMLSKLYRNYWWSRFWQLAYYVVVVGLIFGGYIAIQPYLGTIKQVYSDLINKVEAVKNIRTTVQNLTK